MSTSHVVVSYLFWEGNGLKRFVAFSTQYAGEAIPYGDYAIWGSSAKELRQAEAWLAELGVNLSTAIAVDTPKEFAGALRRIQKLKPWFYPVDIDRMPEPY